MANADALLARAISFHRLEHGVYEHRRNPAEAAYIAQIVRDFLRRDTARASASWPSARRSRTRSNPRWSRWARRRPEFAARLEAEQNREEDEQFCGLFVKNLENVQGDERDIIILSICYAPGSDGRMLMNFGPINQRGGEKRLNVIFSRAKHHMAVVSSIRHQAITNDFNDGANALKNFLRYAEASSAGDLAERAGGAWKAEPARAQSARARFAVADERVVVDALAAALRARGYEVTTQVGQSRFRCDLALRRPGGRRRNTRSGFSWIPRRITRTPTSWNAT